MAKNMFKVSCAYSFGIFEKRLTLPGVHDRNIIVNGHITTIDVAVCNEGEV
jgi:hypothetical protein